MKKIYLLLAFLVLAASQQAFGQSTASQAQLGFLSTATTGSAACPSGTVGSCFVPYSSTNPLYISTSGGGGGGSVSITAGSSNIVVSPSPLTGTGTIDLSATPSVTTLTATTVTSGSFIGGNALFGTTTLTGVINATGLSSGTVAANSYLGLNSSNQVVLGNGGGSGSSALSAITSATATNSIDNTLFGQTWNWSTLTTQTALTLGSSGVTTGTVFNVSDTNASSTGYAGFFSQTATSTAWAIGTAGSINVTNGNYRIGNLNAVRLPDNGADVTSVGVGPSSLAAFATTTGNNVGVGMTALTLATTGVQNTCGGSGACAKIATDSGNTAWGYNALTNMAIGNTTTLGANTAVGFNALTALTTGIENVAIGYKAGSVTTIASNDVIIGYNTSDSNTGSSVVIGSGATTAAAGSIVIGAGSSNTTGFSGLAIGAQITGGSNNLAIGASSVVNSNNNVIIGGANAGNGSTVVGKSLLKSNNTTSGSGIIAFGNSIGSNLGTGTNSVLIGLVVGNSTLNTGVSNIFMGVTVDAALANTSTALSIGVGTKAGSFDTGVGDFTLAATSTNGNNSVAFGYQALTAVTTGTNNMGIGYQAGKLITVGASNLVLGALAGTTSLATGNDDILIGGLADTTTPGASHEFHLHDPSLAAGTDAITITGMGTNTTQVPTIHGLLALPDITQSSAAQTGTMCWASSGVTYDATLGCLTSTKENKEKIVSFNGGLAEVMKFKPISFYYKDKKMDASEELGLLAEDVVQIEPRLVGYGSDGKLRGVRYEQLTAVLISAIQEQQAEIDGLKKQLARHK